jgi:mannose-6-phosphate isomerase-like protein (cupin superfamily)
MIAAAAENKLANGTVDKSQAKVTHEEFGDIRVYHEGRTDQLGALTFGSLLLKPGMSPHPPHQHPEEEIMILTEGSGEISVEGKVTKVAADQHTRRRQTARHREPASRPCSSTTSSGRREDHWTPACIGRSPVSPRPRPTPRRPSRVLHGADHCPGSASRKRARTWGSARDSAVGSYACNARRSSSSIS